VFLQHPVAGLLNPMWLSLICTKLSSPAASGPPISESRLGLYDFSTPPLITQKAPVPAKPCTLENRDDRHHRGCGRAEVYFFVFFRHLLSWCITAACLSSSGHGVSARFIHPDRHSSAFIPERTYVIVVSLRPRSNELREIKSASRRFLLMSVTEQG
jgi:hypothetical protein